MFLELLTESVGILVLLLMVFIVGIVAAFVYYTCDKDKALKICNEIDGSRIRIMQRVGIKKYIIAAAHGRWLTSAVFIFLLNLTFGSFLWSLIMGILIFPPMIFLAIGGFFVTLMLTRPSGIIVGRVIAIIFEISAYLIASTLGVAIGLGIFTVKPLPPLIDVINLFAFVVVPLQAANAIIEAYTTYLAYFIKGTPLPSWWKNGLDRAA